MNSEFAAFHFSFLFFTFVLVVAEFALLDADKYVLMRATSDLRVSYDVFCVLPSSHTQVPELTVGLIKLLESGFSLHDQITDKGADLNGWDLDRMPLYWDSIEVNEHVSNCTWLTHQLVQGILDFTFLSSGL